MQVEVHGWDIHAVSAPGRRAPPVTPGRVTRWRTTAGAPPGRPGRAAARPHDTNAASTGRAPRQPLATIYGTGVYDILKNDGYGVAIVQNPTPRTVSTHLYQIFLKLTVTSRAGLRDALSAPARTSRNDSR